MLFHPLNETYSELDEPSRQVMQSTIAFFEDMGKRKLKEAYHRQEWYDDFVAFNKASGAFAILLTPSSFSNGEDQKRWDTHRICHMNEILSFYGLPYWYAWQVSILGLGPVWMSPNQDLKMRAAKQLAEGEMFAFGLSEKEHGADLYASEMRLKAHGPGAWLADGRKYYIGNGNVARMVSTFAMDPDSKEYVFFVADSQHPNYNCIQNIVAWQGYVAEYELNAYPVSQGDILSRGSKAWDSALNTVNVGKFNLGWASIGIATHAFYEAINHAAHRNLYGKFVTDFPHVQSLFVDAYCRLVAMRMFASRARDYFRSASLEDRRYLLYNPLVKMKVTTQGEDVINHLWDVIAAKGFEKGTYFEMAAKEIRALPKLEGTVHVNMALVVKFMKNYFFNSSQLPEVSRRVDPKDDEFLFQQGPARGLSAIQFHDYKEIYKAFSTPNLDRFKQQVQFLVQFLIDSPPTAEQARDIDFLLQLGECFTLVVYGQLILEEAKLTSVPEAFLDQVFNVFVRDFSRYALTLYSKPQLSAKQGERVRSMILQPDFQKSSFDHVWHETILKQVDAYDMRP